MQTVDQKFQSEIEVERFWTLTTLGKSFFINMLPFSLLVVLGLWDQSPQSHLVAWFLAFNLLNLTKWKALDSNRFRNKAYLAANLPKFRLIVLTMGILTGLIWAICIIFFMNPDDPANVLIISIPAIIQAVGAMTTWYASLAAVLAIAWIPSLALIYILVAHGGLDFLITGLFMATMPVLSYSYAQKLQETVNRSLRISFENAELKRAFEEKSMLLETALENMGQGICMSDQSDRLRLWNRQFTKILDMTEDSVKIDDNLSDLLNSAKPPLPINPEGPTLYQQDNEITYEVRQSDLQQGGRVITLTDISDLMKRERSLKKARKEAIEANCAKIRFLATASHDLRQPIHALGLFFAELSERVRNPQTEKVIGQIDDSIEAINTMLNALLDVSKLDAGIVKPEVQIYSLNELFIRLNAEFQPIAQENLNALTVRSTPAFVQTDPAMLERMLRNLIANALRYTRNGKVLVAARPQGGNLVIKVLDTGPGIPENQLENIFVEFHQLHNPARDRRQGLGLGLAIVKRLANLLQHDLKVASKWGHGSCFSVTLPMASRPMAAELIHKKATAPSLKNTLAGRRLLVLDDDIAVRAGMEGLLTQWGCEVITANSSAEATATLKADQSTIDLIIVDYRLPEAQSGIDIARSLQAELGYPAGILIITGDTGPERLQEAEASGFPLLHKPVQPAKLRSTLQFLISKNRLKIN